MNKHFLILLYVCFFTATYTNAQPDMKDYDGGWESTFTDPKTFSFDINLIRLEGGRYRMMISNGLAQISGTADNQPSNKIQVNLGENLKFTGVLDKSKMVVNGFIQSGILLYHIELKNTSDQKYTGKLNLFMVEKLEPATVFLSIENAEGENYEAYPIFGDQRFTGTWCGNFSKEDDLLFWVDLKTGLSFKVKLLPSSIQMRIFLADAQIAELTFVKSENDWELGEKEIEKSNVVKTPAKLNDGWKVSDLANAKINPAPLQAMMDSIYENVLTETHSVLIAKKGKLVFEKYFSGYQQNNPHDQRSASKSIASAMVGIAIDKQLIKGVKQGIYEFLPEQYQYTKDSLKSLINLQDLLTMSSGLDAIDFGTDKNSAAAEQNYQRTRDWVQTVLEAGMIYQPGSHANYGSANPFLLGRILDAVLDDPVPLFMDQELFVPLGISNYIIQTDLNGLPYFGGGMYLTPRDMLKFGQLYLCDGKWGKRQIISKQWVKDSFTKYHVLENTKDKNEYGYLWWHKSYTVNDQEIESIEARGAGGQYIFVVPKLDLVVAITSGNFNNGRFWQPEKILEEYILPAVFNE